MPNTNRLVGHATFNGLDREWGPEIPSGGFGWLEILPNPCMLLRFDQRIVWCNTPGREFLRSGALFREDGYRLQCRGADDAAQFRLGVQRLQKCLLIDTRGASIHRISMWFPSALKPNQRIQVHLGIAASEQGPAGTCSTHSSLLTVVVSPGAMEPDMKAVISLFNLTLAEAKVTVALLDGKHLSCIATQSRVSIETVRRHLKSIFVKTNTHRQSDLVALLLRTTPPVR